jgi:hypothetical protein
MESQKEAITAQIGLFSGRPNPVLSLAGEAVEQFVKLVQATIGKEPIHPPPPPRLGYYYGFLVVASRSGLPAELNVYYGVVTEGEGRDQKHWRDVAGVERFLIVQAYQQGYGELLEKVGVEKPIA